MKGYDEKPKGPPANATPTEQAAFKAWMSRDGVARSTILLGMEPRIQAVYLVVEDVKMLGEKFA
jgi:hypothetical protein